VNLLFIVTFICVRLYVRTHLIANNVRGETLKRQLFYDNDRLNKFLMVAKSFYFVHNCVHLLLTITILAVSRLHLYRMVHLQEKKICSN
jgi:hypothetical protein